VSVGAAHARINRWSAAAHRTARALRWRSRQRAPEPCVRTWAPKCASPPAGLSRPVASEHLPHLHRDWAHPTRSAPGPGSPLPTSAPGLGSPLPHLHRDRARPFHICTGTGLAAATSGPGPGSPFPHLDRDLAHPGHICAGSWDHPPTSAPRLGLHPPSPHRDWAHPLPNLRRAWADRRNIRSWTGHGYASLRPTAGTWAAACIGYLRSRCGGCSRLRGRCSR
jgi:hypothetical protein